MKKAAMFGLDARIALAIFGALSVISGAALYSAIKQAKVIAIVTEMTEIGKAFEAYYLDTGQFPAFLTSPAHVYDAKKLLNDTVTGWAGPYASFGYNSTDERFIYSTVDSEGLFAYFEYDDWGFSTAASDIGCSSGEQCGVFIQLRSVDRATADEIDLTVDGSLSPTSGQIRLHGDVDNPAVYYRIWSFII